MHRLKRITSVLVVIGCVGTILAGCDDSENKQEDSRRSSISQRADNFDRAEKMYPAPNQSNFPIRKALVEFTKRQDLINHPWYIYLLGMTGTYIGYYVGETYPISTCNFLSSTEVVHDGSGDSEPVLTAPSLDGIYYGGGGASSACESLFFFDATTHTMITFSAPTWFASDQPLPIDAPKLNPTGT